jgi:hypothetical protein
MGGPGGSPFSQIHLYIENEIEFVEVRTSEKRVARPDNLFRSRWKLEGNGANQYCPLAGAAKASMHFSGLPAHRPAKSLQAARKFASVQHGWAGAEYRSGIS